MGAAVVKRRVLLGIVNYGYGKVYALPKLEEMLQACVIGTPRVDIEVFGMELPTLDFPLTPFPTHVDIRSADLIVYTGKELIRQRAIEGDYDAICWQGVDAYYHSRQDFEMLLQSGYDVTGTITMGRHPDSRHYPVVRRFTEDKGKLTGWTEDVSPEELEVANRYVSVGFPGSETMVIDKRLFHIPVAHPKFEVWFKRSPNRPRHCTEEFWCWQAAKQKATIVVDPRIRVYHAHDDLWCSRFLYPDTHLEELTW